MTNQTPKYSYPEVSLNVDDPVFGIRETERQVGLKKSSIYEMVKKGTFPPPLSIGRKNGWLLSQLNQWKRDRIAEARKENSV